MRANNQFFQKNANLSLTSRLLWLHPGTSRVEIAKILGLDKSTVTNIIAKLFEKNIVVQLAEGKALPQGGRKTKLLGINENFGCVLGIEIQPSRYKLVVINIAGHILFSASGNIDSENSSFKEYFFDILRSHIKDIRSLNLPVIGIGIGIPGLVNPLKGNVIVSKPLDILDYDFFNEICPHFEIPVLIENDANCCAWGELMRSKGNEPRNFFYVLAEYHGKNKKTAIERGMGVGLGVVIDGRVYYGSNYSAGEFKSIFWDKGRKGQMGISDSEMQKIQDERNILKSFVRELVQNLFVIVSIINPSHIFIGGDLSRKKDVFDEVFNEGIADLFKVLVNNTCTFDYSNFEVHDVAWGAASMYLQKIFAVPQLFTSESSFNIDWEEIFNYITREPKSFLWFKEE